MQKKGENKRIIAILVRVNEEELDLADKISKAQNKNRAEYLRELIFIDKANTLIEELKEIIKDVRNIRAGLKEQK